MFEKQVESPEIITNQPKTIGITGKLPCAHCGDECPNESISLEEKYFCCEGCKSVYEILAENNLCTFYTLDANAGTKQNKNQGLNRYAYLDDAEICEKLINFKSNEISVVKFSLPQIHCTSCVWLLEKLYKINPGIIESTVDINRKTISIKFDNQSTTLRKVVETLSRVGYAPDLTLDKIESNELKKARRNRLIKLGVAGFCFGNIMMLSLPDYFSFSYQDAYLGALPFRLISFILSLPVILYCASEFYIPAYKGLRNGFLNIDAPVFLAVLVTFVRSIYELLTNASGGYFDSMSGIVFFMLLGRVFQDLTYKYISFDKTVSSFIPLAISKKIKNGYEYVPVTKLERGDIILIRNEETIPTDGFLKDENATIDYSFVTGESDLQNFYQGNKIYAGGKLIGKAVELTVGEKAEESYLHSIWNNKTNNKSENELYNQSYIHKTSKWFTVILFAIAFVSFTYWSFFNLKTAFDSLTTILIVACPCVLLLSHTYTYGFISRILTRNGIYLRNTFILDQTQKVTHLVFDKTGTLTTGSEKSIEWFGETLTENELSLIKSLTLHSTHPKSKLIYTFAGENKIAKTEWFKETPGMGITAKINDNIIKIGSPAFHDLPFESENHNRTYVSINNHIKGFFRFQSVLQNNLNQILDQFPKDIKFSILSGDNEADKTMLESIFPKGTEYIFNALPHQKLAYIKKLQNEGNSVAMVGDGINDSGALLQANIGISIAGENSSFVPACDVYIEKNKFHLLAKYFRISKYSKKIVLINFGFALVYNTVGLMYTVTGSLSPGVAAILMPISTFTIISSTFLFSYLYAKRIKINALN